MMAMTDPIADMLTRIRNAARVRHQKVTVPWSRLKENVIKILIDEGYLKEQKKVKAAVGGGDEIIIQLKFDRENRPIISGLKRVSTPGRRVYVSADAVTPVRKGLGINILSTPKGILVDRDAQRANVGGELLCSVW
jgi:small subunit ribosomal protein S8